MLCALYSIIGSKPIDISCVSLYAAEFRIGLSAKNIDNLSSLLSQVDPTSRGLCSPLVCASDTVILAQRS